MSFLDKAYTKAKCQASSILVGCHMHVCIIIYFYALYVYIPLYFAQNQTIHIILHEVMRNKKEEREKEERKIMHGIHIRGRGRQRFTPTTLFHNHAFISFCPGNGILV